MCSIQGTQQKITQSIEELIDKEEYLTHEINSNRISTKCTSFISDIWEVDIKGTKQDGDTEDNLFVKVIKASERTLWISLADAYKTELYAYEELSKLFTDLQEEANVPQCDRNKLAKIYAGSNLEVIILENLTKKGFQMYDRKQVVSLHLAEIAIKELAKLHGLSFALQLKRPEYFDSRIKGIKFPFIFNEHWRAIVQNLINLVLNFVDDDVKCKAEHTYNKLADKYAQFFEDESKRRCLCHGDYRLSNMMVKMNNGRATDFIVVDYQTLHYGCPVLDLIYFFYVNTDRKFRQTHMGHLKDLYHETLRTFLQHFNIDVESIYSRKTFEQDFKDMLDYGLLMSFVFLPIVLMNENDVPSDGVYIGKGRFNLSDTYRDRNREIIEEFIQWGYM